jgi:hypothetical protein
MSLWLRQKVRGGLHYRSEVEQFFLRVSVLMYDFHLLDNGGFSRLARACHQHSRAVANDRRDSPSSRILHSFLNFLESSSSCLSIALLLSLLPRCSGASANAALNPCAPDPFAEPGGPSPLAFLGGASPLVLTDGLEGRDEGGADGASWSLAGAVEALAGGLGSDKGPVARLGSGVDMHPPMVTRVV